MNEQLILNTIREQIKSIDFESILLKEYKHNKLDGENFEKIEDICLLRVFTEKCFCIIENYIGRKNYIDFLDKDSLILQYIEEQEYYSDGNYLNIIDKLKNM